MLSRWSLLGREHLEILLKINSWILITSKIIESYRYMAINVNSVV